MNPKIYLPSTISKEQMSDIICHEKVHIERKDYLWKLLGYVLLSIYWFNPMIWLAYLSFCSDIEGACDQQVIENMDIQSISRYSETLLQCSVNKKSILTCPVAFGEVNVKQRIMDILNYHQPKKWMILGSIVLCLILGVGFICEPFSLKNVHIKDYESDIYTDRDIQNGIETIYKNFQHNFGGCALKEIEYAGDSTSKRYHEWAIRHNADEAIVFYIVFDVDSRGGDDRVFNPNETYIGFKQILVRKNGQNWRVVDGGYG
jgi:hypothetical protein